MNRDNMWNFHILLGLFALMGLHTNWNSEAFNVETRHYTSYHKEQSTMFGFSVAEYRDGQKMGWVIVGAPQAQTKIPFVYKGGAVYRCRVAIDDSCDPVIFDKIEHNRVANPAKPTEYMQIDNKTLQWFGATVSTSMQDGGPILACAPRYVFFGVAHGFNVMNESHGPAFGNQRDPVGTCFMTNFTGPPREFSPCRTKNYGYHKQGSCQAGFAAALSKDGERIFVGAPGSWYWQGQMYSIATDSDHFPFAPPRQEHFGAIAGQIYTQQANNRDKVAYTKESPKWEDDSYLGYSVTAGDFDGSGEIGTAVGMPRGSELYGKVVLLTTKMFHIRNITGAQMGSYFGYALAAGDIDNDGLDDLIVGAPMYTVPENPEMNFETGRIYIFYGKGPNKYDEFDERDGEWNRGRFGLSLAYLGDIDRDGYGDFAVGAPYAGPEGQGAVYIYQGSAEGVLLKYSQVIHAEELSHPVQTFGFSLAGGLDLDGNLYPDLVVGSYESGYAMFFRSRPVIKMVPIDTYVEFSSSSKLISLDDRACVLSDGTRVTCLQLKACFKYTGDGVLSRYNFNVQYILDVKKPKSPRMCFLELEGRHAMNQTITVGRNQPYCRTVKVYVTPNIRDKLTPLDAEMRIGLQDENWIDDRPRDPSLILRPVMATTSSRKDTVSIFKNCGSDNICTPDLQMTCRSNVVKYLLGSDKRIELNVTVQNAYEDAFEATYNLMLPPGIDYIKIERIDKAEIPVHCSPPKQSNNNTLKCDIGNPLPNGNLVQFTVLLQPMTIQDEISSYEFEMEVNSSNSEPYSTTHDNRKHLSLKIWVETELLIEGESKPKDLYYYPENYTMANITTELEYGPAFTHNYTIRNRGPSRIEEAEIYLSWPAATLAGDHLLYLMEQPETSGPIICESANADPLSLKIEQKNHHNWASKVHGAGTKSSSIDGKFPTDSTKDSSSSRTNDGFGIVQSNTTHFENTTHIVTTGPNGEVVVIDDEIKNVGGIITTVNVTRTETQQNYEEKRHRDQEAADKLEQERRWDEFGRRRMEEERARSQSSGSRDHHIYGSERHFETSSGSTSSQDFVGGGSTPVFSTGIRHSEDSIIGNREDTYGATDFNYHSRNSTTSQNLDRLLAGLTHDAVGYEVYNREGKKYLQFLGRFRVSTDDTEYIEFKDGAKFPLENSYGGRSYAERTSDSPNARFMRIEGMIVIGADGRVYVQLSDGRKFPLEGSWTYTEERTYTNRGRQDGGSVGESQNRRLASPQRGESVSHDLDFESSDTASHSGGASFSSRSEVRGNAETRRNYGGERSSWKKETARDDDDYEDEYEIDDERTHEEKRTWERKQGSRSYGSSIGAESRLRDDISEFRERGTRHRRHEEDGVSVRDFRKYEKQHHLHKRQSDNMNENYGFEEPADGYADGYGVSILPKCEAARCVNLRCSLGRLEKDEEVWISARYRVKAATLKKVAFHEDLKVSTQLVSRVTKLPSVGRPAGDIITNHEIITNLQPKATTQEPEIVPLWVVVLSACAGTIILLLLILLLYKCGFFKRNRPTDAPERQPLNRNGHFNGDDHL